MRPSVPAVASACSASVAQAIGDSGWLRTTSHRGGAGLELGRGGVDGQVGGRRSGHQVLEGHARHCARTASPPCGPVRQALTLVPVLLRFSQASTTRAAIPASAALPQARGS